MPVTSAEGDLLFMKIKTIAIALLSGAAGSAAVMVGQGTHLSVMPIGMTFTEWAGILLASVAILITALGVVVAIAAIWGFSGIKAGAESAAVRHVAEQFEEGGSLSPELQKAFKQFLELQLKDDKLRRYMEERVNVVLYRGPQARAENEDETEGDVEFNDPNDEPTSDNDVRV